MDKNFFLKASILTLLFITVCIVAAPIILAGYQEGLEAFYRKDYLTAIEELKGFMENNPEHLNASYLLGLSYYRMDEPEMAEKYLSQAYNLAPGNINVANNLARVLRDRNKIAEGIALLNQFLIDAEKQDSELETLYDRDDLAQTYNILGTLYLDEESWEKARISLERAVKLNGNNYYAWNNLGYVFIRQGKFKEALHPLQKAVALEPPVAFIYNNLGIVWENLGELNRAAEMYKRALEIKPDYSKAKTNLQRVQAKIQQ